ncbi:hypothetical protein ACFLT2_06110 [Acidobacteriota bacterium]
MSVLTILWSMVSAACLTLAFVHFNIWLRNRKSQANLFFTWSAIGAAGCAVFELLMLRAKTTEAFEFAVQYNHITLFILLVSLVWFVEVHFKTAQR